MHFDKFSVFLRQVRHVSLLFRDWVAHMLFPIENDAENCWVFSEKPIRSFSSSSFVFCNFSLFVRMSACDILLCVPEKPTYVS